MSSSGSVYSHPAIEAVAAIDACLDQLFDANLWSLAAGDLAKVVLAAETAARRLDAARVMLTAQADTAQVAEREGATSTAAWLRAAADVPAGATKARLALRGGLASLPAADAAFRGGRISMNGATAVWQAMGALPGEVPAALLSEVEALLVDVAAEEGTAAVTRRAAEITHRFAPDALEQAETKQAEANRLRLTIRPDGSLALRGQLDKEAGALALAVLSPYAAPAPATDGTPDFRDADQRNADALVKVLELASATSPDVRGERPHLLITIGHDALLGRLGAAPGLLPQTGAPISPAAARQLACDAKIIPIVLGGDSQPLDIGRATRVVPAPIRRALVARDAGCAMPGCDRPPGWCDAHHIIEWAKGGPTAIQNLVLVCERHHTLIHRDDWQIELRGGQPWFTPPPWIDQQRKPRLNSRYKTRELRI